LLFNTHLVHRKEPIPGETVPEETTFYDRSPAPGPCEHLLIACDGKSSAMSFLVSI